MRNKMHLTTFFFLLVLFCSPLYSQKKIDFSSDKACFDGSKINFDGNINLKHPQGILFATKAEVINNKTNAQKNLLIELKDNISFQLKKGGEINCKKALIDNKKKKIIFFRNEKSKIEFNRNIFLQNNINTQKSNGKKQSQKLSLLANKGCSKKLSDGNYALKFTGDIKLTIGENLTLFSDKALLVNNNVTFYPKTNSSLCKIYFQDIEIFTPKIEYNLKTNTIFISSPRGKSKNLLLSFFSSKLEIKDFSNFHLSKNASVDYKENFIESDNIELILEKKDISKIYCQGLSKINIEKALLITKGPIEFDSINDKIYVNKDKKSNIQNDICLFQEDLTIFGKKATIFLIKNSRKFTIEKAVLENDIYFVSNKIKNSPAYGIAKKLHFFPEKHLFILEGAKDEKVLFSKSDNNLSISADKIEIYHHKNCKEDIIKGKGKVRFSLNEIEKKKIDSIISKKKIIKL